MSAGASIIDVYIQRELGDDEFVCEDQDYQMTGILPPYGTPEAILGKIDLEKGGAFASRLLGRTARFRELDMRTTRVKARVLKTVEHRKTGDEHTRVGFIDHYQQHSEGMDSFVESLAQS